MMSIMYKVALIIDPKDNWKVNQQIQCFIINIYIYFLNSQIINVCIIFKFANQPSELMLTLVHCLMI